MVTPTDRRLLVAGAAGVVLYVGTWFVLGIADPDYDPARQAISELFDLGAPRPGAWVLAGVLAVTGVLLGLLGPALDRTLPGTGRLGPVLVIVAGAGSAAVALFPCTDGCPGFGSSFTDSMHVVTAGVGYLGLVTAPLAFAWRLRGTRAGAVLWAGVVLGGVATVGFLLRDLVPEASAGLLQRVFNTAADLWYVVAAVWVLRTTAADRAVAEVR